MPVIHQTSDSELLEALEIAADAAPEPILILGESGSGKEIIARAIVAASSRADRPLIQINASTISDELGDTSVFGHRRGAFTGADRAHDGLLAAAHGGTLHVDEVADLSLRNQARILRVLDRRGEYRRVGEVLIRQADLWIICSTNRDLSLAVRDGHFRADLMYRLDVIRVDVPPLRARRCDIPGLIDAILRDISFDLKRSVQITSGAQRALIDHPLPGNIRQLRNVLVRAAHMCKRADRSARELVISDTVIDKCLRMSDTGIVIDRSTAPAVREPVRDKEAVQHLARDCESIRHMARKIISMATTGEMKITDHTIFGEVLHDPGAVALYLVLEEEVRTLGGKRCSVLRNLGCDPKAFSSYVAKITKHHPEVVQAAMKLI